MRPVKLRLNEVMIEFFSPEADRDGVFSDHEKALARFNRMHLEAVTDAVNGRSLSHAEQARVLAARAGLRAEIGQRCIDLLAHPSVFFAAALGFEPRARRSGAATAERPSRMTAHQRRGIIEPTHERRHCLGSAPVSQRHHDVAHDRLLRPAAAPM